MRNGLFSAAAVAPLAFMAAAPALAANIGDSSTTVQTSTANGGQPDNVTVTGGSTVNVDGAGTSTADKAAVVLNSNNTITNNGTIQINAASGNNYTDAVQLNGGFTMPSSNTVALTNAGTISNTDGYTPPTNNTNGYADGAFAQGSNRYGVRLIGSNPLYGSINLNSGSSITVQGNNSYGISLEAPLASTSSAPADFLDGGSISVTGDNTIGLSTTQAGSIGNLLQISGAITATGAGAQAVNLQGDVGGAVSVYGAISATGYRNTVRNIDPTLNAALTSAQITQSGAAVTLGSNLQKGFFLGAPPAGTLSSDTKTDADNDGVVDSTESSGSITSYAAAPALVIGSASRNIEVGLSPYGAQQNTYGVILEGGVTGQGVYDSYSSTGLQVGGLAGGYAAKIDGGISITNTSSVSAQAYQANAAAIHFGAGASTPLLNNAGSISAQAIATTSQTTPLTSAGLQIDAGATLNQLTNTGIIKSSLTGDTGSAIGVVDSGGHLSSVINEGTISAVITPASPTDTVTGSQTALDLSHNTTGVSLLQQANPNPVTNPATNTTSSGAIVTFAGTVSPAAPSISGDIFLGSGTNSVDLEAGTVTGGLNTGAGATTLTIKNGASYSGALVVPGTLAINVDNGSLIDGSTSRISAPTLNVGSKGVLDFALDPAKNAATQINVAGAANIADGAQLGVKLLSLLGTQPSYSYTVITAQSLSVGASAGNASISGATAQTPYLYVGTFTENPAQNALTLNVRRRTAAEANVNRAEAAAWDPVYNNLGLNPGIESAFLSQTTAAGYKDMLEQVMPDYAGGAFRALAWTSEQQGDAAADPPLGQDQQGPTRAWTQEIVLDETKNPTADSAGYSLLGFGGVLGVESVSPRGNALGAKIGFTTVEVRNPQLPGDNLLGVSQLNAGIYWRGDFHGLTADAQLGAGFIFANDRREFLYTGGPSVVHNVALANWSGYTMNGRFGLQYRADFGRFFLQPKVHADYFRMYQTGYTETGGGAGYDLAVDPRSGDLFSVTGSMLMGMTFGNTGFRWAPQVEIGYRDVLSGGAGTTTALFVGGTPDAMNLAAEPITGGEMLARAGIRMYTDYVDVLLDAGAQLASNYSDIDVHLTARTVF